MRRLVRAISSVLILSGILLVADAGVTLLWQEPVTAVIALVKRGEINKQLVDRPLTLSALDNRVLAGITKTSGRIAFYARLYARRASTGQQIGTIEFPKLHASYGVVQGTDTASLEEGPGHYPATAFPGVPGDTVAIAGHRTTYLAPFRYLNEVQPGDLIVVTMPYAKFTYRVERQQIVTPTSLWITANKGYQRLVLSACNPLYSASQRIAVFARLYEQVPMGAAARA
ncbi:MAG TPA: class E sortase [Solirubrobacteraceae bacterium]|nr:class E sortase [Solirubrobacteraceae bacterium]